MGQALTGGATLVGAAVLLALGWAEDLTLLI